MFPHIDEAPELPYNALSSNHLLYDLVYNPEVTMFLKYGAQHGATVKNGQEMLELQAIAGWNIWTSK
jgi:shikimate dehydrogenase